MSNAARELNINEIEPGCIHLIEANAGTGKTYAIANLFLRYILKGKRIHELLVVTFARDATDELRGRVRARLAEARKVLEQGQTPENADDFFAGLPNAWPEGEKRQEALNNLELALLEINEAPILTIHAFCQQTLTDMAFSSGQSFDLEQASDDDLKLRAMQDWWRKRTYELKSIKLVVLQTILPDIKALKDQLDNLLKSPTLEIYRLPPSDVKAIQKKIQSTMLDIRKSWQDEHKMARELLLDENYPLNRNCHRLKTLIDRLNNLDACLLSSFPSIPDNISLKAISKSKFKFNNTATAEDESRLNMQAFTYAEELLELLENSSESLLLHELDDANNFVRTQVLRAKQRLGQLSFDDMIERLHDAILTNENAHSALAKKLSDQYPVIMVDEFQDTDPLQYAIFKSIHQAKNGHTLILIGDPKQAIYGFRGGDIFTYMQARRETDQHWSLSVNWRSTEEMIHAVNTLFGGNNPFTYEDIPYNLSHYPESGNDRTRRLIIDGQAQTALSVEDLPRKPENPNKPKLPRNYNKSEAEALVHESVAGRIAELLQPGKALLGDKPLQPADIAILVSEHKQGKAVRKALLKRGVRAVAAGKDSIWETTEAQALQRLLEAALLPTDRQLLRQALAEDMLNLPYHEIYALTNNTRRWGRWVDLLTNTGNRWQQYGFMSSFQYLLQGLSKALAKDEATDWLERVTDPERTLTNLLHLAELLQTASREHATGEQLLVWMTQQTKVKDNEDLQLRLESDEELVKIITIHKSKGLQYPVVFVPYIWGGKKKKNKKNPILWHETTDNGFRYLYAPVGCDQGHTPNEHERLAEDIRKAYVALTRAESHCHLFLGSAGDNVGRTALAWLLSSQDTDLERETFEVPKDTVSPQTLNNNAHIKVIPPTTYDDNLKVAPSTMKHEKLENTPFKRSLRTNWRIGSFSAMTRDTHQSTHAPAASGNEHFALRYPAGANVGNFLHTLLEHLNPTTELQPQIEQMAPWLFRRYGIRDDKVARDTDSISIWMHDVLNTPLDTTKLTENSLTLARLGRDQVLRELDFDLGAGLVLADNINELLCNDDNDALPPIQFDDFQGMLTGTIDLVFEYESRYFIADYKSNLLGRQLEDYTQQRLADEIINRRYNLQYLLYTLALHRHLKRRLPNYDYEKHFGGAYYLFLRAMQPKHGSRYGIHYARPDAVIINRLDTEIIGYPLEEIA